MNRTDKVLHADDDQKYLNTLRESLYKLKGRLNAITPTNAGESTTILKRKRISGLSPDSTLPKPGGPTLLADISRNHPQIPCAAMARHGIPDAQKKRGRKGILCSSQGYPVPNALKTAILEGIDLLYEDVFWEIYGE